MSGISIASGALMPKKKKQEITTAEKENLLLLLSLYKEIYPHIDRFGLTKNELVALFKKLNKKNYIAGKQLTDKGRAKLAILLAKMSEHNRHQQPGKSASYPWHDKQYPEDWLAG